MLVLFTVLSGVSGLIYEVAWIRVFSVILGSHLRAVSTIVAIFMGGLALGSWWWGRRIDAAREPLCVYGILEIGLGVWCSLLAFNLPTLRSVAAAILQNTSPSVGGSAGGLFCAAILLPPTILMGGTVPVLVRSLRSVDSVGRTASLIYGGNVLGAVAGCLLTAFVLIPRAGITNTIASAAGLNLLIGVTALVYAGEGSTRLMRQRRSALLRNRPRRSPVTKTVGAVNNCESGAPNPSNQTPMETRIGREVVSPLLWGVAFVSGFLTIAVQILWTRQLVNLLTANTIVYATVLAAFLLGLGVAGLLTGRHVRTTHGRLAIALSCNGIILFASAFVDEPLAATFDFLHRSTTDATTAAACFAVVFAAVVPAATVAGMVFPLTLRLVVEQQTHIGEAVGRILFVNTTGAIAGSLLTGFLLVDWFGVKTTLIVLSGCSSLLGVPLAHGRTRLAPVSALACALLVAAIGLSPKLWFNGGFNRCFEIPPENVLMLAESGEATIAVAHNADSLFLTVNGTNVAESSRSDLWDLMLKAHLPMLLHESPEQVAVVGLGAGVSLGSIVSHSTVRRVDCVELCPAVIDAQGFFDSFNHNAIGDARVELHVGDGRQFLQRSSASYDIINVDPVDPPVCNQYTQEFVQVCHNRLKHGGLMVQWIPLFHLRPVRVKSMIRSFLNVFPHTTMWYDGTSILLIGRRGEELRIDVARFKQRLAENQVRRNFSRLGHPTAEILLSTYVTDTAGLEALIEPGIPANTDDHPRLEYALLFETSNRESFAENLEMLRRHMAPLEKWPLASNVTDRLIKTRRMMNGLLEARIRRFRARYRAADTQIEELRSEFGLTDQDFQALDPFLGE